MPRRGRAFEWHTIVVDGHDVQALLNAYAEARATKGRPTMILARTVKGKGLAAIEGKDGWHGKALKKGEEADKAVAELEKQMVAGGVEARDSGTAVEGPRRGAAPTTRRLPAPAYKMGDQVATREAWGVALAAVGGVDPRIVALDADVKNSTFSDKFEKVAPDGSSRTSSPSR